ncbi:MAG: hypothetical protein H0X49_04425 [Acidobacteria bacterium]|nr:hypothetical protein [Acidobacteriota bacterium]
MPKILILYGGCNKKWYNRYGEVVGARQIMMVNAQKRNGALIVHLLQPGEWLDLRKHKPRKQKSLKQK